MALDTLAFRWINNLAGDFQLLDAFGVFAATFLLPLMVFLLIPAAFNIKKIIGEKRWEFIIRVAASAGVGYFLRSSLGFLFFRPRPFVAFPNINTLITMGAEQSSFPSGHSTVAFAIAFTIFRVDRDWGSVFLILASLVALGRVFVGVHYPSDIIAGVFIGWLSSYLINRFERREWSKFERTLKSRIR